MEGKQGVSACWTGKTFLNERGSFTSTARGQRQLDLCHTRHGAAPEQNRIWARKQEQKLTGFIPESVAFQDGGLRPQTLPLRDASNPPQVRSQG